MEVEGGGEAVLHGGFVDLVDEAYGAVDDFVGAPDENVAFHQELYGPVELGRE